MKQQWQNYSEKYSVITLREQILILISGLAVICLLTFHFIIDSKLISNKIMQESIKQLASDNRNTTVLINEYQLALKKDHNVAIREKISQFEKKLAVTDSKLLTLTSKLINPVQMRAALLELLKVEKGVELLSFELMGAEPLLSFASDLQNEITTTITKEVGSENSLSHTNKPDTGIKKSYAQQLLNFAELRNNLTSHANKKDVSAVASDSGEPKNGLDNLSLNLYKHGIKIKLSGEYFALQRYLHQLEQLPWQFFWQEFTFEVTTYPQNELFIEIYSLGENKEFIGV